MASIYNFNDHLSIHDKFEIVKTYYEKNYKIKFKKKPPHDQIEDLFQKIGKLHEEANHHFFKKPGLLTKFIEKSGLKKEE